MSMKEMFVVDCSVSVGWLFDEQSDAYTEAALEALEAGSALAPRWWGIETLNVLLALERRQRIPTDKAIAALRLLQQLPIRLRDSNASLFELHALAREHGLSSYDALYLDTALATGLPLATRDHLLQQAAQKSGVGLWTP